MMFEEAQDMRIGEAPLAKVKKERVGDVGTIVEPCVVCGDASTGIHYRVQSCEGCKGFWRRTIQRSMGEKYNCKIWTEQCVVNKETRGRCQRCRYLACLRAGMVADLVMADKERNSRLRLVAQNRERRKRENGNVGKTEKEEEAEKQDKQLLDLVVAVHGNTLGSDKPVDGEGMVDCVLRGAYKFLETLLFQLMGARDLSTLLLAARHEVALIHLLATCSPEQATGAPHLAFLATSLSLLTPRELQFATVLAGMRPRTTWPQHSYAELHHLWDVLSNIVGRACGRDRLPLVLEVSHQAQQLTYFSAPTILLATLEGVIRKAEAAPIQITVTNLEDTDTRLGFSITPKTPPRQNPPMIQNFPPTPAMGQSNPVSLIKDSRSFSVLSESQKLNSSRPAEAPPHALTIPAIQPNHISFTTPKQQTPRLNQMKRYQTPSFPQMPHFQSPAPATPPFPQNFQFGAFGAPSFPPFPHTSPQNTSLSPQYLSSIPPQFNLYHAANFSDSPFRQHALPPHPPPPYPYFPANHPSYPPPQYLPQYPNYPTQNPPPPNPDIKGQFPLLHPNQMWEIQAERPHRPEAQDAVDPAKVSLPTTPFTIKTEFDPDAGVDLTITEFQANPPIPESLAAFPTDQDPGRMNFDFENNISQASPPQSPPSDPQDVPEDLSPGLPLKKRKLVLEYPQYHSM